VCRRRVSVSVAAVSAQHGSEVWREEPRGGYPDPRLLALSGRERIEAFGRGHAPAPPLTRLTGALITGVGSGTANGEMPASGWLLNSAGAIGGGTLAIVADIALGLAIQTELPPATPYTTAELSMTFLRPAQVGCILSASGQAIHVGRSVALSEAFVIEQGSERLIAHGTSRCAVLPPIEPLPEAPDGFPVVEPDPDQDSDPYRRPPPADSIVPQETWERLGGREILARQLEGELPPPPIHDLTGMRPTEFGEGEAVVRLPATKWLTSPAGTVQGGVIAMLADTTMLIAVQTIAPTGAAYAGLDLKVNYLRPVHPDGRELTARGSVVRAGRTIVIARAEVENADGKPVALATGSSMYLPGRPMSLGEVELAAEAEEAQ
jgi:uncharacterized protein (TIGR00369 family)